MEPTKIVFITSYREVSRSTEISTNEFGLKAVHRPTFPTIYIREYCGTHFKSTCRMTLWETRSEVTCYYGNFHPMLAIIVLVVKMI